VRLDVDLSFDAGGAPPERDGARHAGFHDLAGLARRPRALLAVLREQPWDVVTVRQDGVAPSAVQAGVLLALAGARTRRFELRSPSGTRRLGRAAFAAYAAARAVRAVPAELIWTGALAAVARRAARREHRLPRRAVDPRRVLYVRAEPTLRWFGRYVGGAATHTSGVINGFAANGLDVEVWAADTPDDIEATVHPVRPHRAYDLVRGVAYTDYARELVRAASGHQADFVYQRYALGSFAGLELARRLGVPLVLEFNGSELWVERNWGSGSVRLGRTLEALEMRNLTDASLIVVVSDVLRDEIVSRGVDPGRVLVNPNGVDTDALATVRARSAAEWRAELGLPEAPTVGFIGTFGQWHGAPLLPAIADGVPGARFVIVGDGLQRAEVEAEVRRRGLEDRVLLTGLIERERAVRYLAACDVCVSPHVPNPDGSRFFGSPTKLFEYMGLGKAIVAADLEQIGEVIDHERTGLLHPPGDVDAAAAAVRRLLGDDDLRERLAAAALAAAETTYSWRAHTERILDRLASAP
jgi:glycosyltransferase involved in cell wall biosynthesis